MKSTVVLSQFRTVFDSMSMPHWTLLATVYTSPGRCTYQTTTEEHD
jgi:hypothetical protein